MCVRECVSLRSVFVNKQYPEQTERENEAPSPSPTTGCSARLLSCHVREIDVKNDAV